MLTVGTFAGSKGPIHYPPGPLKDSARFWNGRPVVVYHPSMKGSGYADHPEMYSRQKVGVLFNTRFVDGTRLVADAWIDEGRVTRVDKRVLAAIHDRRPMEVSTGMVVELADGPGVW